jgi:hypothetical protein
MEHVTKIMPLLWSLIEKHKKCSVGIATIDGKLQITLLWGKFRFKKFADRDMEVVRQQVVDYLRVA